MLSNVQLQFQLTYLLRGTTSFDFCDEFCFFISTHVPLARYDLTHCLVLVSFINFNSRTSCEVRHRKQFRFICQTDFNSRTSCEVRLNYGLKITLVNGFQLTYLLRGTTFLKFQSKNYHK